MPKRLPNPVRFVPNVLIVPNLPGLYDLLRLLPNFDLTPDFVENLPSPPMTDFLAPNMFATFPLLNLKRVGD